MTDLTLDFPLRHRCVQTTGVFLRYIRRSNTALMFTFHSIILFIRKISCFMNSDPHSGFPKPCPKILGENLATPISESCSHHRLQSFQRLTVFDFRSLSLFFLWPPCVADADIIFFLSCGFFYLLLSFFSSPILSRCRLDVYYTSTHGVALVRI